MSVADPYRGSANITNPTAWNRYSYVNGDPVNISDPTGLYLIWIGSGICTVGVGEYEEFVNCDFFRQVLIRPDNPAGITDDTLRDEWDNLTGKCQNGLKAAIPGKDTDSNNRSRVKALNRALSAETRLTAATAGTSIDWTLLAAIGIRETGFRNINQPDGLGVGVFQIDLGQNPNVTASQASNLTWAATWAANYLNNNMAKLGSKFPSFTPDQLLQATAASYNLGVGGIHGNPNTIDVGSTRNNYGSNILDVMDCFR